MSRKKWLSAILVAALSTAAVGCSMPANSAEQEEKETPVQVETISRGSLSMQNKIIGFASPDAEVRVVPKTSGELSTVSVAKNDIVQAGAVLGKINTQDLQIQLEMEQIALEQAQIQYKNLHTSGASQLQIDQAKSSVDSAQLRVQLAQNRVKDATITAPIAGIVTNVNAKPGELVSSAAPFVTIMSIDPIRITASVSTNQMMVLQNRTSVDVELTDLGKTVPANVTYISPAANEAGFYTIEAELANPDHEIKPGMTAKFVIDEVLTADSLLVPTRAIVEKGGKSFVFVIADGRAVEKEVEVLEAQSDLTAINADIADNAQVVVKGQMTISDGGKVKIIEGAQ